MRVWSKRFRVPLLAAVVAAVAVPVGFALSLESGTSREYHSAAPSKPPSVVASSVVVSAAPTTEPESFPPSVPGAAKLLFVGTALFGLAAVVRKAI